MGSNNNNNCTHHDYYHAATDATKFFIVVWLLYKLEANDSENLWNATMVISQ